MSRGTSPGMHTGRCPGCGWRRILVRRFSCPHKEGHGREVCKDPQGGEWACRDHDPCGPGMVPEDVMTLIEDLTSQGPRQRPSRASPVPVGPEL